MIWITHNCFSLCAGGLRVRYALLLLFCLCFMVFGREYDIGTIEYDGVLDSPRALIGEWYFPADGVKAGDVFVVDFPNSVNELSDINLSASYPFRLYINYRVFLDDGSLATYRDLTFNVTGPDSYTKSDGFHIPMSYTFTRSVGFVRMQVRCIVHSPSDNLFPGSFRYILDAPVYGSASFASVGGGTGVVTVDFYDDLVSNFVSIGAVLLAVPLAIFFIYKGWSFVRGGFMAFFLLSSVLAFARGDTNPNPVPTGYIENTDGTTAFYADYVTNQQFADFAGVQTTETYDFNNPYADVDVSQITSNDVSGIQADFSSVAGAGEAQLQLQHMQQDFNNARYQGLYNSTPIMLMPAAFSSSAGGVVGDTIFSAPPVWQIFSTFDTNSFGYFSVQSAFNLLLNCLGFFIAISVMIFLVRSFTSH